MNFLQLCQRVFIEGGISGQLSSTQNTSGEALRVVGWVQTAYEELLNDQPEAWSFVRKTVSKQITAGIGTYSFADLAIADGVQWDADTFSYAVAADFADEALINPLSFADFKSIWRFGPARTETGERPADVSIDNDTNIVLGPIPSTDGWLTFDYKAMPALLSNADVPVFPSRFHMAIVWRALRHYGLYEAAPEVVARADIAYKEVMLQLTIDQTPEIELGEPLC